MSIMFPPPSRRTLVLTPHHLHTSSHADNIGRESQRQQQNTQKKIQHTYRIDPTRIPHSVGMDLDISTTSCLIVDSTRYIPPCTAPPCITSCRLQEKEKNGRWGEGQRNQMDRACISVSATPSPPRAYTPSTDSTTSTTSI